MILTENTTTTSETARFNFGQEVSIPVSGGIELRGNLRIPAQAVSVVLFAHGSGSSRFSPRNRYVSNVLLEAGMGTLLTDLLSEEEDTAYETRFDIALLSERLVGIVEWLKREPESRDLKVGLFGASTGAAAALQAAAMLPDEVACVVSRGGRPDLAGREALERVSAPTLLIVGARDVEVLELNRAAHAVLNCKKRLHIVPRATHLFEEPGTLEEAADVAKGWFEKHLR